MDITLAELKAKRREIDNLIEQKMRKTMDAECREQLLSVFSESIDTTFETTFQMSVKLQIGFDDIYCDRTVQYNKEGVQRCHVYVQPFVNAEVLSGPNDELNATMSDAFSNRLADVSPLHFGQLFDIDMETPITNLIDQINHSALSCELNVGDVIKELQP